VPNQPLLTFLKRHFIEGTPHRSNEHGIGGVVWVKGFGEVDLDGIAIVPVDLEGNQTVPPELDPALLFCLPRW
jgi:hypothetical protein